MSYYPTLQDLKKLDVLSKKYITNIYLEIEHISSLQDIIYKFRQHPYSIFTINNNITILCLLPEYLVETNNDILPKLNKELFGDKSYLEISGVDYSYFRGGFMGSFGYDNICHFEKSIPLPKLSKNNKLLSTNIYGMYNSFIEINNNKKKTVISSICSLDTNIDTSYEIAIQKINKLKKFMEKIYKYEIDFTNTISKNLLNFTKWDTNFNKEKYIEVINDLKKKIKRGDLIQIVPSRKEYKGTNALPEDIYIQLCKLDPLSQYKFIIKLPTYYIIGSSPELLLNVNNNEVITCPIAGTRPRGKTPKEDLVNKKALIKDIKENAEHVMLVDLARNDIGKISKPGTVYVKEYKNVKYLSHVMHLCSTVVGEIRDDLNCLDALKSIFPAGTLSGAPKICAMKNIYEIEKNRRGVYGGGIGFIDYSGVIDMCIGIRTLIYQNNTVYLQAGGGIVFDSDPLLEYLETTYKMGSVKTAVVGAEKINLKRNLTDIVKVLIVDNYDSFTYNIYQLVSEMVDNVDVIRNDEIEIDKCTEYTHIILGPGPYGPDNTANFREILDKCKNNISILGICLGHQCIYHYFGGKIKIGTEIIHGKTSEIETDKKGLFQNLPKKFNVMRYHSLVCDSKNIPDELEVTCATKDGVIMGIKHTRSNIVGIQFHPESIEGDYGQSILKNFLIS